MKYLRADILYILSACVCLVFGIFSSTADTALDVNVHDTYYVIAHSHFYMAFVLFFCLLALVQFLLLRIDSKVIKVLSMLNWCFMALPFTAIIILLEFFVWPLSERYYGNAEFNLDLYLGIAASLFLLGLFSLLVEMGLGIFLLLKGKMNK